MLYCEKCKSLIENDEISVCVCGRKKLRAPLENDPVYLTVSVFPFSRMLEDILAQEGIPYLQEKEGVDLLYQNSFFGVGIGGNQKIRFYIPYGAREKGKEILEAYFSENALEEASSDGGDPDGQEE